jgi:hypothetical protein
MDVPEGIEIKAIDGERVMARVDGHRINGVAHRGHVNFKVDASGVAGIDWQGGGIWLRRVKGIGPHGINDDPTPAARNSVRDAWPQMVQSWLRAHPTALAEAAEADRLKDIARLDSEIADLELQIKQKRAARARLHIKRAT